MSRESMPKLQGVFTPISTVFMVVTGVTIPYRMDIGVTWVAYHVTPYRPYACDVNNRKSTVMYVQYSRILNTVPLYE